MKKKLCILFLFLPIIVGLSIQAYATPDKITLNVGYIANYGTVKAAYSEGSEGYGYEYLTKLIDYMDGDYTLTFVPCSSWQDGLDKLDSGELDILGPTTNVEDGNYIYSSNDFGQCTMMLSALSSDTSVAASTTVLDGSTIGIPDYYVEYSALTSFLEVEGISATLVSIPSQDLNITMGFEDIDYVWMSSLQTHAGLTTITGLDAYPVYFIASPENQELMDNIDEGLVALAEAEPYFQSQLALEYDAYHFTTNAYISESDLALAQAHGVYRVGIRNFYSPLIREGATGQLEGMAFTFMDILSETAGITFEYVMLDETATQADFDSTDFVIAATDYTTELGFPYKSDTYFTLPFILLEHRETSSIDLSDQRIGVANYYCADALMVDDTLYGREVVKYDTVHELQQAFDLGEIDCMLITIVSLNMIREDFKTQDFITTTVEDTLQLSLAFSDEFSTQEMTVFNKLISTVDQNTLDAALLQYSITNENTSLQTIIEDNPWILINSIVVIIFIIFVTSMVSLIRHRRKIIRMIDIDSITGIMTEHKFIEEAQKILKKDTIVPYHLITLDIDNFKYVNEIYGYEIGTALLKILGHCMSLRTEPGTIVARGTADRFMILAPMVDYQQAVAWIESDIKGIHTTLSKLIGKAYKLHFSIGMYEIYNRDHDITVMLDYANIARQHGKLRAATSVSVFTPQMQQEIVNNNYFTSIMEQALEDEEFILHYQPKVCLQTGELKGAEALVRWQRAAECMPPYHFIPLFEKNGFIEALDYYVLTKACVFLQKHAAIMRGRISVNLSGVTILQEQVVQNIIQIVMEHDIVPSQLDLEITETAFVDSSSVLEKIQELRKHGFTISMDDFGAGISSLNRLKNIHVDTLKIDREFIIDAIENPRGSLILKRMIQMADDLQLETVAEGIETLEQGTLLQNLGCQIGQGYYYARPMPEDEFVTYCQKSNTQLTNLPT